jgi:hypothetical protein
MNRVFNIDSLQNWLKKLARQFSSQSAVLRALTSAMLALSFAGCGRPETLRVQLQARAPTGHRGPNLQLTAEVAGPQNDLHYKWFSVAGGCNPQESDSPTTLFKFADGTARDRVTVEVWRDGKRVGRSELAVKLDETQARLVTMEQSEDAGIEITQIPPYEPAGGPDTHADIAGKVSGKVEARYSVVLYARASEVWYIQPTAYAAHALRPDNTWTSWTHTGSSYAALLVRPGFEPVPRLDLLPQVGGYVLARTIVDGVRK